MKIIYLHQQFYNRNMVGVAGTRSYELGRRLVNYGHTVNLITSATEPPPGKTTWYTTDEDGIKVHWLPLKYSNKTSFAKRRLIFAKFALSVTKKSVAMDGDVVFATSGPLTIAIPALWAAWRLKKPFVFEVRDLWPDGAIQLNVLKNPIAKWLARRLEKMAYRRATHIVALSPGMKEGIVREGISPDKVTVIPNASDCDLFRPDVDPSEMRKKFDLDGKFSLAYFGTMGLANGLGYLLDVAAELKKQKIDDVVLILHGDGMERRDLEARAKEEGLENVKFADPVPQKSKIAELCRAVDVSMTIYKNVPVLYTCSPNKMFDSFAAGTPVLTNMKPGWLSELVEKNECGIAVEPDNPRDFVEKVVYMKNNPELLKVWGKNARALAELDFDRDKLALKLDQVLREAAGPVD
jgi:glycosyltransferase involved in cell wall biosynthesis